jgi:CubicO group peptidase (beta-lactamase class C family)
MKSRSTSIKLIIAVYALSTLTAFWGAGRVAASVTPALPSAAQATGKDRTDLDIFALGAASGVNPIPVDSQDWNLRFPGYNLIRSFTNKANQKMLFLLNGHTGEAQTFVLNADGSIGKSPWWTALNPLDFLRCTSADIIQTRSELKLVTQDSFTGMVRVCTLNDDGSPTGACTEKALSEMQDKNLFQVYYHAGAGYQMIGLDTWSGKAVTYGLNLQKSAEASWTRGWTSLDSLYFNGVSYRLLYKAAGDPYKHPNETSDQIGRLQIQAVGSDGVSFNNLQEIQIAANYSTVRFVEFPSPDNGLGSYGVFCYRRTTGEYVLYQFNPLAGLGKVIDSGKLVEPNLAAAPPYSDLQPCVTGGKPFLAFVSADHAQPLGFDQANQMAQTIYDAMNGTTVGYQFVLAQSGRIMYRRAWGKVKLDHDPAAETNMTTHTQLEIGSVSKMITAMTVLKLAEQGKIKLSDPIANYLAPGQAKPGSWAETTTVRNLLTHTTGLTRNLNLCTLNASNGTVDCSAFFAKTPNLPCDPNAPGGYNCNRDYNGSNFRAARKVIEFVTNTETSAEITQLTRDLWARSVGLDNITCQMNTGAYYYGPCPDPNGAANCFEYGDNKWWLRAQQTDVDVNNWLPACSSRHWYASSRELMAFLGAIRYRQILNPSFANLLLSTDLSDLSGVAGSTALSWERPVTLNNGTILGKAGSLPLPGAAARAYIARLPHNCDVAIQLNTKSNVGVPTLVEDAFQAAVP